MAQTRDPSVLTQGAALVDLGGVEVLRATGADRVSLLHRLLTGPIAGAPVGGGCRSLLLNVKGHIVEDFVVLVGPDWVRLVVAKGQGAPAAAALSKYAIMDDFVIAPEDGFTVEGLFGPGAVSALAAAGVALPGDLYGRPVFSHVGDSPLVVRVRGFGADGLWLAGSTSLVSELVARLDAAGVPRLAPDVAEAARIAAGEPRWGAEISEEYFPMEAGLDAAIDYGKGCYLGQEPIVRIRDRGHINWRLMGLRFDGAAELPARGARLATDARPKAGRVTSVGRLPRPDGGVDGVALAMVHVSVPAGTSVRVHAGEGEGEPTLAAEVVEAGPA